MTVDDIMTRDVACCTPDTSLREVARLMLEYDCGELPVVNSLSARDVVGVITDRDIVCRVLAKGENPLHLSAGDSMTSPAITVPRGTDLDECAALMEENRIRRVPVIDADGRCCGIVAQADIARAAREEMSAEILREISTPEAPRPENR